MSIRSWFGAKEKKATEKKNDGEPRPSCHGCLSDQTEMVVPASPEVLSYRCTKCGRQWSIRAPKLEDPGTA